MAGSDAPIIVIKKIKKGGHGHHGGAWKVAYADFVTAMMAFFLLMWLINTTSPEQKRGIADYFAPASVSKTTSGAGGLLGGMSFSDNGARADGGSSFTANDATPSSESQEDQSQTKKPESEVDASLAKHENLNFERAAESLRQAMQDQPELAELSKHLIVDMTPEGLRIQIVDQDGRPMFKPGLAEPTESAQRLLAQVAKVIERLPNRLKISGHTDSAPFFRKSGYSNWDLSADRANVSRRILEENDLDGDRIYSVVGKAGSEPLFPDDPFMAANRRISIVLLRETPVLPPSHEL